MRLGGWIFMLFSWGLILGLAFFCFRRIFKKGLGKEVISKKPKGA